MTIIEIPSRSLIQHRLQLKAKPPKSQKRLDQPRYYKRIVVSRRLRTTGASAEGEAPRATLASSSPCSSMYSGPARLYARVLQHPIYTNAAAAAAALSDLYSASIALDLYARLWYLLILISCFFFAEGLLSFIVAGGGGAIHITQSHHAYRSYKRLVNACSVIILIVLDFQSQLMQSTGPLGDNPPPATSSGIDQRVSSSNRLEKSPASPNKTRARQNIPAFFRVP